jgi:hypothetical protein
MRKKPQPKTDTLEKMEAGLNAALRKRGIFLERQNFALRGRRAAKIRMKGTMVKE